MRFRKKHVEYPKNLGFLIEDENIYARKALDFVIEILNANNIPFVTVTEFDEPEYLKIFFAEV